MAESLITERIFGAEPPQPPRGPEPRVEEIPDRDEEDPDAEASEPSLSETTLTRTEAPAAESRQAGPITWEALPARWPELVRRYAAQKPLTASPLYHSGLCLQAGETPELEITFADEPQRDLFLADGDNKRALQIFLADEIGPEKAFTLAFRADPAAAKKAPSAAAPEKLADWLHREPVLRDLIELFEGRVLDLF